MVTLSLHGVYLTRLKIAFKDTVYDLPKWVYLSISFFIIFIEMPIMGLAAYAEIGIDSSNLFLYNAIALLINVCVSIPLVCLFCMPFIHISKKSASSHLLNDATRFFILSATSLGTTLFLQLMALFAYSICDYSECPFTWIYWWLEPIEMFINVLCASLSLKGSMNTYKWICNKVKCHKGAYKFILWVCGFKKTQKELEMVNSITFDRKK